jgi:hypothetical protein
MERPDALQLRRRGAPHPANQRDGVKKMLPPIYDNGVFRPSWASMTEAYCSDSGLTRNEVFARLLQAGFHAGDFVHLEDLAHPQIRARMEPHRRTHRPICRSRKSDVVAYLRGWAVGIEEFRDRIPPSVRLECIR